jgi:hypothetical protein
MQEKPASPIKEVAIAEPILKKDPEQQPLAEHLESNVSGVEPQDSSELKGGPAIPSVIKLNQFNNFQPSTSKLTSGPSEEEKKKLREMRFAGKHVAENTFDVSHVSQLCEFKLSVSIQFPLLARRAGKAEDAGAGQEIQFGPRGGGRAEEAEAGPAI